MMLSLEVRKGGTQLLTSPFCREQKAWLWPNALQHAWGSWSQDMTPRRREKETHAGARNMFGSEDHAKDLSPGAVFKAYSSGLYWLPALMTRLCRAQLLVSQGKNDSWWGRTEFAGCTAALVGTPKLTGLFWNIENVTEEGFDKAWSEFLKSYLKWSCDVLHFGAEQPGPLLWSFPNVCAQPELSSEPCWSAWDQTPCHKAGPRVPAQLLP